jgi:hypothetical protein
VQIPDLELGSARQPWEDTSLQECSNCQTKVQLCLTVAVQLVADTMEGSDRICLDTRKDAFSYCQKVVVEMGFSI